MEIRELSGAGREPALQLAWTVFQEFVAPDYAPEGGEAFRRFLQNPEETAALRLYGAFDGGALAGMLALCGGGHIALFFVDGRFQRKGVGRRLLQKALAGIDVGQLTVNASPCSVEAYRRLGFTAAAPEQTRDGIRFTPMSKPVR